MINTPKPDIKDTMLVGYIPTHILVVGTYVEYRGIMYIVGSTVTIQTQPGEFTTTATLHPVDPDGDMLDEPAIELNLDMYDPKVL